MRNQLEITEKITELKNHLSFIGQAQARELEKDMKQRNLNLLHFLYKEKSVYESVLSALEWVLTSNR
jgi:hypothetical protein